MSWIIRIGIAVVYAIAAYLLCVLVGTVLATMGQVPIAAVIGAFIERFAGLISALVFLAALLGGPTWGWPGLRPRA